MNVFGVVNDPHIVHAIVVHFPIALGILGIPLVFLCAVGQMKNVTLRWVTFTVYAAMAALSFVTVLTGEQASNALPGVPPPDIRSLLDTHQTLGENTWIFASITAAFLLLCGVKSDRLRSALTLLAMIMCLATGAWVATAGYYGEVLVFKHGVGAWGPRVQATPQPGTVPAAPGQQPPANPAAPIAPTQPAPPSPAAAPSSPSVVPAPAGPNPQSVAPAQPIGDRAVAGGRVSYTQRLQRTWRDVKNLIWPSN